MLSKLMPFHSRKLIWKCRLWNGNHFVLGLNMLTQYIYSWTELHWYTSSNFYPVSVVHVIGFNHGLPWCVKYMARGPPVTTKPDGEAGGFCGDRRPEGHVFHTSRQAMIKTYYSTSIRKTMVQNCSYFTQMKSTTTAIYDSNRRRNKLGLGCSREATAPLILIFKLLFLWLNIGRHFKGITQFHNCHSPKHTSKKYYPVINIFREICTKIIT